MGQMQAVGVWGEAGGGRGRRGSYRPSTSADSTSILGVSMTTHPGGQMSDYFTSPVVSNGRCLKLSISCFKNQLHVCQSVLVQTLSTVCVSGQFLRLWAPLLNIAEGEMMRNSWVWDVSSIQQLRADMLWFPLPLLASSSSFNSTAVLPDFLFALPVLCKIGATRHIVSTRYQHLVWVFVLSRLDDCNSLLGGCPVYQWFSTFYM